MAESNHWHENVPDAKHFEIDRHEGITALASDNEARQAGLKLLRKTAVYGFGHKHTWLGVPVIRLPEDLVFQQDLVFSEKPDLIVEIGVARGGGLVFNASIQQICGLEPKVLGVDNRVFPHTRDAVGKSAFKDFIEIIEGDSVSKEVVGQVAQRIAASRKTLLVLDSDHSYEHVLCELEAYAEHLPSSSLILVCDTLIDELPKGTFKNRTWENGRGPLAAIEEFLRRHDNFVSDFVVETNSLLLSEIRNGVLRKVN